MDYFILLQLIAVFNAVKLIQAIKEDVDYEAILGQDGKTIFKEVPKLDRFKRDAPTQDDKQMSVDAHNEKRRIPPASNMEFMVSSKLEPDYNMQWLVSYKLEPVYNMQWLVSYKLEPVYNMQWLVSCN